MSREFSHSDQPSHEKTPRREPFLKDRHISLDAAASRELPIIFEKKRDAAASRELPIIFKEVTTSEKKEVSADYEVLTDAELESIADWARNLDHDKGRQDLKRRAVERGLLPPARED
ncbi:hypothetical protein M2164_000101 [Streptomyces sp. SAI-208]|uniref:hypothetical protein n=1 Tax=Streptomyces sp. SAI-208 TaxID=2940550 RepID=UPI0024747B44|nr:hypothetical protein [Streptomyces sp. SAI-208]MDH6604466.1 hypothetical protein [Streptomyces sp. SAI-208]